ncbi:LOW QUALITY PROTEIN: extracellular calcium-sensing receptor [Oreochromis niloticus]|uniref:LOW QUALITY PROTEIN: extracellular calcium-sensing receptor n=1 Tax=Oreochromis niloticus TaxID=8128 RepID=UPI000DF16660|nr:LOW QUALITY PROTEIN: extracellular calcium-sensing receptor [Oreochromis niloticus]
MIGGIFPVFNKEVSSTYTFESEPPGVNCAVFDLRAFRWTQAMIFAVAEINNDPAFLPNISLGYRILNSCSSPTNTLRAALTLASRPQGIKATACSPITSVIAEAGSSQSLAVAGILGPFQVPIVSYFSTCACLSDRTKYPTFFRTIPSDYFQAKALAALVKHFGWQWIGAIQSDNDYGRNAILAFKQEVEKFGVCIAFVGSVLRTYTRDKILEAVEMIKQSTVKVILAFAPEGDFSPLMKEVVKQNITGIQWLGSEAWITAPQPSTPEIYTAFGGALGFVMQKMAIPKLKHFLTSISPYTDPHAPFVKEFWQIMVSNSLQKVNFINQFGDKVFFDENGNPPASYEIINWQMTNGKVPTSVCSNVCPAGTRKAQIKGKPICCFDCVPCAEGTIANLTADCTPCPKEYWSNDRKDECIPRTIEFLKYHEPMGIALTLVSLLGASLSLVTMVVFINYRETPVIKASNFELSSFLLFSLFLCFLCPLTFLGMPTVWTCMLRHTAFGVTFALCISCVLGKTIVVVTAFKATFPGNKVAGQFGHAQQRIIVCSCTLIQIVTCVLWLTLNPPYPHMLFTYSNRMIALECNTGSEFAFYAVLGYIGILAIICLILAFMARKLPDNFNEAKLITFSLLIFCAVWITFIPAYVSSPGKFTVAVEIFAILSSAFGLLICIFAPKCYIIFLKPEKNTKKHVMGKSIK